MSIRIAGVMSTHRPDATLPINAAAAASQVDHLFLVDDTGAPSRALELAAPHITVLSNDTNVGLATSLNRGVRAAIEWGATHVLTLDDDTGLPRGYTSKLARAMVEARASGLPVLTAGPRSVGGSSAYRHEHSFGRQTCSLYVMQSGLMFDVEAFRRFGLFRDEFFIDAVEHDYLARLHRHGFHTMLVDDLDLPHVVGEPHTVRLGFRTVTTSNHSAFRFYYMTRNMLTFVRDIERDEPIVAHESRTFLGREILKMLAFEHDRPAKLRAVVRGYRDYRRGKFGKETT